MFTNEEKFVIGIIASGIAAIIGLIANRRSRKVAESINRTIDELSKKDLSSEIAKDFLEEAAKNAVDRYVEKQVADLAREARKDAKQTFNDVIQKEVNAQYSDTKSMVVDALHKKIGEIDISDAKREVIIEAKRTAAGKFREALEEVVRDFRDRLNNTNEIYSQFAKMFKIES